jgi:Domain of unknown function (DUF4279)
MTNMSMPPTRTVVWAEFMLRGEDLQPAKVTAALNLKPSRLWLRDEPRFRQGSTIKNRHSGWRIGTDPERTLQLQRHVSQMVDLILPRREAIRQILLEGNAGYIEGVAQCPDNEIPDMVIPNETLRRIADLGLYLSFDLLVAGLAEPTRLD